MCFQEYIAYQCGHCSFVVVRPCPMTTAGHNFPVCSKPPSKQYFAETMCPACERQMHSRWVLIREWEHRWLHERGACGCDVVFPGLLTTPRVIGDAVSEAAPSSAAPTLAATPAEENQDTLAANPTVAATSGDSRIPALFSEAVTSSGEHHVSVRLPGLYAAEWRDDHRALHQTGKCTCQVDSAPFQPQIPHEELTSAERDEVHRWEQEVDKQGENNDTKDVKPKIDEDDARRIAEIEKLFGKFTVGSNEMPTVSLPSSAAPAPIVGSQAVVGTQVTAHQGYATQIQGHNQQGAYTTTHQNQQHNISQPYSTATYGPPGFPAPQQPFNINNNYTAAVYPATAVNPSYPIYQAQTHAVYQHLSTPYNPYTPAHPTFATPATYTNTIPASAYNWHAPPQRTPNMPWTTQGPGPYRSPGLEFSAAHHHQPAQSQQTQQTQQGQVQNSPQPAATAVTVTSPLPILGLPIGAGPEGTSHMPSWKNCRLRSASVDGAATIAEKDEDEEEGDGEGEGQDENGNENDENDGNDDGSQERRPPPRRLSAPT